MKPEDVPDDLADDAVDAWHEAPRNEHGLVILDDHMRYVLAAVLPAHERQVREQVAAEIEAAHGPDRRFPSGWAAHSDRDHAAHVARGESR